MGAVVRSHHLAMVNRYYSVLFFFSLSTTLPAQDWIEVRILSLVTLDRRFSSDLVSLATVKSMLPSGTYLGCTVLVDDVERSASKAVPLDPNGIPKIGSVFEKESITGGQMGSIRCLDSVDIR